MNQQLLKMLKEQVEKTQKVLGIEKELKSGPEPALNKKAKPKEDEDQQVS